MTSFSDSVIYSEELLRSAAGQILKLIKRTAQFQFSCALMSKGPMRGAITMGPFFHDSSLAYGPALVEAANLEKEVARSPRIILSSDIVRVLSETTDFDPQGFIWFDESDRNCFVGYLAITSVMRVAGQASAAQALNLHKLVIEDGIRRGAPTDKFGWLAHYHNAHVAREHPERADLTVIAEIKLPESENVGPIGECPWI